MDFSDGNFLVIVIEMKFGILLCTLLAASFMPALAQRVSSEGTDFWTAFPTNDPNNLDPANLSLSVTSKTGAIVTTTMTVGINQRRFVNSRWQFTPSYDTVVTRVDTIAPLSALIIPVDTVNNLSGYGKAVPYSLHLTSTAPVRVFTLSHKYATSDGVTVLPTSMLDTDYVLIAHQTDPAGYRTFGSIATFIAANDSTFITVTPSVDLLPYTGPSFTVLLRKGEVYSITSDTNIRTADLTGTIVTGSKPFAVLSGVERTYIYSIINGQKSRNYEIEQMLPVKFFSTEFVVTPTKSVSPTRVKVVAAFDATTLRIGDSTHVIDRGKFVETGFSVPTQVYSTRPVLAVEENPSSDNGLGDPFMALVAPLRAFDTSYVVNFVQVRDSLLMTNSATIFFDTIFGGRTHYEDVPRNVRRVRSTLDSSVIGSAEQYAIVTTVFDSTFFQDSTFVHNFTATKTFVLDNVVFYDLNLSALLRSEDQQNFLVDGKHPADTAFKPTLINGYLWCDETVSAGAHTVTAPHGFSLLASGYGTADAYGYMAGVAFEDASVSSPGALNFGSVRVHTSRDSIAVFHNTAQYPVNISSVHIDGPDAIRFAIQNPSIPAQLLAGDSLVVHIRYSPDTNNIHYAALWMVTNYDSTAITLTGKGAAALLFAQPSLVDFGTLSTPGTRVIAVKLCNVGDDTAFVTSIGVAAQDSTTFHPTLSTITLLPGECATFNIRFTPLFGGTFASTVMCAYSAPFIRIVNIPVTGKVLDSSLFVRELAFDAHPAGTPIDSNTQILNTVGDVVRVDVLRLVGADAAQFEILSPPSTSLPVYVQDQQSLSVSVRFLNTTRSPAHAAIRVFATAPCADILLSGNTLSDVGGSAIGAPVDDLVRVSWYPNPFVASTSVIYGVSEASHVRITIVDLLGHEVTLLVNSALVAGRYVAQWDPHQLPYGVYFYHYVATSLQSGLPLHSESGNLIRIQ